MFLFRPVVAILLTPAYTIRNDAAPSSHLPVPMWATDGTSFSHDRHRHRHPPRGTDYRLRRGLGLRGGAGGVLRTARPAAAPAAGGAARDRRHPDRADRRSVPSGGPRAGPQSGGRLPRHGEPAGAAQGADAAAARRRGGWLGGPAGGAGAAAAGVSADSGGGGLAGAGCRASGRSSSPGATCRRHRRCRLRRSRSTCSTCSPPSTGSLPGSPRRYCTAWWPGRWMWNRPPAGSRTFSWTGNRSAGSTRSVRGATIVDVLSTLLALLELAKRGSLRLVQSTPFCPMVIARESPRPAA